jgi:hypothetical protein
MSLIEFFHLITVLMAFVMLIIGRKAVLKHLAPNSAVLISLTPIINIVLSFYILHKLTDLEEKE